MRSDSLFIVLRVDLVVVFTYFPKTKSLPHNLITHLLKKLNLEYFLIRHTTAQILRKELSSHGTSSSQRAEAQVSQGAQVMEKLVKDFKQPRKFLRDMRTRIARRPEHSVRSGKRS